MEEFLDQIEKAMDSGLFYLALFCCLALPDICGAISSENGVANRNKYKAWFNKYVAPKYHGFLDGDNCYAFRCAAIHQGRASHEGLGYDRILFVDSHSNPELWMHKNVLNGVLNLDTRSFCSDIIEGVRQWIADGSQDEAFKRNYITFLRRHKKGLDPLVSGVDVFS